jgi:hypothetical protein
MNELLRRNYNITSEDDYIPSPSEEKLLQVRLDPENIGKNITDLCQTAGISRQTYYSAMQKPEFVELLNRLRIKALQDYIADVIDASYRTATTCGSRGFQDRKMLLEMAGLYRSEQSFIFNANVQNDQLAEGDFDKKLQKLLERHIQQNGLT